MTQWLGPVGSWQSLTLLALGLAQNSSGAELGLGETCVFISMCLCPRALKYVGIHMHSALASLHAWVSQCAFHGAVCESAHMHMYRAATQVMQYGGPASGFNSRWVRVTQVSVHTTIFL